MFKAGDIVRRIERNHMTGDGIKVGEVGTVDAVTGSHAHIKGERGTLYHMWEHLELVSSCPVREVTRREVIPGTYGRVIVGDTYEAGIWFEIADDEKGALILTAEELDNVAMIASQIAEALRDG